MISFNSISSFDYNDSYYDTVCSNYNKNNSTNSGGWLNKLCNFTGQLCIAGLTDLVNISGFHNIGKIFVNNLKNTKEDPENLIKQIIIQQQLIQKQQEQLIQQQREIESIKKRRNITIFVSTLGIIFLSFKLYINNKEESSQPTYYTQDTNNQLY